MKKLHNWLSSVQFSGSKDQLFLIITLGKLVKASCSVSDYIVCLCRQSYYMIDRFIKTIQYTYDDHIIQTTDTMRVLAHMTHLFLYDMHWILRGNFTEWRLDNSVTRETDFHQNVSIFLSYDAYLQQTYGHYQVECDSWPVNLGNDREGLDWS